MKISSEEVFRCLTLVREFCKYYGFIDMHAHPFEVMYGKLDYRPNPMHVGVFSQKAVPFMPSEAGVCEHETMLEPRVIDFLSKTGLFKKKLSMLFEHTGPAVFKHEMSLANIRMTILLPVASSVKEVETQMSTMQKMFGNDKCFLFGCCVPGDILPEDVGFFLKKICAQYDVRVVKFHPNVSNIDLKKEEGKNLLESVLVACNSHRLPLVIHGGRSPVYGRSPRSSHCCLNNFLDIDWNLTDTPVIIAHAGSFGCGFFEYEDKFFPILRELLNKNEHLLIDTSHMDMDIMTYVVGRVEHTRIVFGSDALYQSQWLSMTKLVRALENYYYDISQKLLKIAFSNSYKYFCKTKKCTNGIERKYNEDKSPV